MSNKEWISLHTHSEFSLFDGTPKVDALARKAKEHGVRALALTDHGTIGGSIKFFQACKDNGIKPIIGMEAYVAYEAKLKGEQGKNNNHLLLLAKNEKGFQNLKILSTLSYEPENFYRKPRIDFDMLDKYGDGLIVSSACLKGEVCEAITQNGPEGYELAKGIASRYKERFKDDYYIELMFHGMNADPANENRMKNQKLQAMVFGKLLQLSKELGIPTILTNDVHCIHPEDHHVRNIKISTQGGKPKIAEDGTVSTHKYDDGCKEYYFKSPEEVYKQFSKQQFAIEQTIEVADKCNLDIALGSKAKVRLPNFDIPDTEEFKKFREKMDNQLVHLSDTAKYLTYLAWAGLAKKKLHTSPEHVSRLKYELAVITKTEYAKYFVIVADYIEHARSIGLYVGPGRGSAAGSLMCFCLGITNLDPIKYGMSFERFLAAEEGYIFEERDFL